MAFAITLCLIAVRVHISHMSFHTSYHRLACRQKHNRHWENRLTCSIRFRMFLPGIRDCKCTKESLQKLC